MSDFVRVSSLAELQPGQARTVEVGGNAVALYNVGGTVYATSNTCAHRGGPLGEGSLDGTVITCPWHGFQYDVTTGVCKTSAALKVQSVAVRVNGQDILIQV